jgi:hypothetical protein
MFVTRFKAGAEPKLVAPAGAVLLSAIFTLPQRLGRDILITCSTDSHGPADPHSTGEAYDIGLTGWSALDVALALSVFAALGGKFYAQYEVPQKPLDPAFAKLAVVNPAATGPHIHAQRAKGTIYTP